MSDAAASGVSDVVEQVVLLCSAGADCVIIIMVSVAMLLVLLLLVMLQCRSRVKIIGGAHHERLTFIFTVLLLCSIYIFWSLPNYWGGPGPPGPSPRYGTVLLVLLLFSLVFLLVVVVIMQMGRIRASGSGSAYTGSSFVAYGSDNKWWYYWQWCYIW